MCTGLRTHHADASSCWTPTQPLLRSSPHHPPESPSHPLFSTLAHCPVGLTQGVCVKVLHMDRNDYYGGESASVNLNQLFERFGAGAPSAALGNSRDYNIDLAPKVLPP